jgi:hypothetical protein
LLFTFFISMVTGLLFGLAPALQSTSPDVVPALKDDLGPVRLRRFGLRNVLVAFQMALSVVLLVGGGLFVRSLGAAQDADLGFTTRNAGIAWVDLSLSDVVVSTTFQASNRQQKVPVTTCNVRKSIRTSLRL